MKRLEYILGKVYEKDRKIITDKVRHLFAIPTNYRSSEWHKNFNLYVTYPDSFCTKDGTCNLETLKHKLSYIQKLGIDAIHILPFLKSPMIDFGFDISDYKEVRKKLGGNSAFEDFIKECRSRNIKIFMDLVLNHVSNKHTWYQKAINGSDYYREFFIHSKKKPKFIKKEKKDNGIWATYEYNGSTISNRIIFPDFVGKIPHWKKEKDGYWYYHTFYPHQIDLNWHNPNVFLEFVDILEYWSRKGLSFRLDAITFVAKDIKKGPIESNKKLHYLIEALNIITKKFSKDSVFLVEVAQHSNVVKKYFGKNYLESELAYNFNLMNAIWSTLLNKNSSNVWTSINKTFKSIPYWANWINFLRNHDELTLEFASSKQRRNILKRLEKTGIPFRQGFGVAGRTTSLLNNDISRLKMAYSLLASLPGNPALVYGDEIGKLNDKEYLNSQHAYKIKYLNMKNALPDTRDINRGRITEKEIKSNIGIYKEISKILTTRKSYNKFFFKTPSKIGNSKSLFLAKYEKDNDVLTVAINLTSRKQKININKNQKAVLKVNNIDINNKEVILYKYSAIWLISTKQKA